MDFVAGLFLLVLTVLIPLVFSPFSWPFGFEEAFEIKRTILEIGAMALLMLGPVSFLRQSETISKPLRLKDKFLLLLPALFVLYLALHVLVLGPNRIASRKLYEFFCLWVIFAGARDLCRDGRQVRSLLLCIFFSGLVAAIWGLLQLAAGIEPYSTLGNRNFFATFLLLVLSSGLFFLWQAVQAKQRGKVLLYGAALVLVFFALCACKSKAAWLVLFMTGLLVLVLLKKFKTLGILLIVAALGLNMLPLDGLLREIASDVRPFLWSGALKMGWSHPWVGVGLGQYFIHIPQWTSPEYFLMGKSADTILHAHNDFLEIFAETGGLGLFLFLAPVLFIVCKLSRRAAREPGPAISLLLLVMLCEMLIKSMLDMDLQVISSAYFFWLILGVAWGICGNASTQSVSLRGGQRPTKQSRSAEEFVKQISVMAIVPIVFLTLIGGLLFAYSIPFVRAQFLWRSAELDKRAGLWQQAQEKYEKAIAQEPSLVQIPFQLGYAYTRTGAWDKALHSYERVRELAPFYSNVLFNMAVVCHRMGKDTTAMHYLKEGFQLNPYNMAGHEIAREIFLGAGQIDKARQEENVLRRIVQGRQSY